MPFYGRQFQKSRRGRRPRRRNANGRSYSRTQKSVSIYKAPRSVGSYRGEWTIRKLRFTLNEGEGHLMSPTSGPTLSTDYVYRANDLFDPFAGIGGQQPRTFDQIITMYRNFVVLGSKLVLNLGYDTASSTSKDVIVACCLKDGSTAITGAQDLMENQRLSYRLMTAQRDNQVIVRKYSYKINGVKDALEDQNLWGTAAGSPPEAWYYHIVAYCPNNANAEDIRFTGYIDYTAIFFHGKQPPSS